MSDDLIPLSYLANVALNDPTLKGNARTYALPYLDAMLVLDNTSQYYGMDSGDSIVRYALSNLTSWRGDTARTVKRELKAHLEAK